MKTNEGMDRVFLFSDLEMGSWGKSTAAFDFASLGKDESLDLVPVKFKLCREGANANGDVFARSELLKAWKSPRHKPFDIEHAIDEKESYFSYGSAGRNHNTIIGHITDTALAMADGEPLAEKEIASLDQTDDFNREAKDCLCVLGTAVLYAFDFPRTVMDLASLVPKGQAKVSMENWYAKASTDYLVGDEFRKGQGKDDPLAEKFGKRERVDGKAVKRVLRGVVFAGAAAVRDPADKGCIFLRDPEKSFAALVKRHDEIHILNDAMPSSELEKEHEEVTRLIAEFKKGPRP